MCLQRYGNDRQSIGLHFLTWWKVEGRPGARKMIELSPACIQNKRSKRRERAIRPPRVKEWVCFWHRGLELESFTETPRALFSLRCLSIPAGSRRGMEVGCLSCLAMETQETNHSPRVWCHGGHIGTLEEPLTLAVLQESTDLHPDRKGLHLSGLLCSNFNLFTEVAESFLRQILHRTVRNRGFQFSYPHAVPTSFEP